MKLSKYCITFVIILTILQTGALAASPYTNYTYQLDGQAAEEPQAYYASKAITGIQLNINELQDPQDIYVDKNQNIYISDAGNNRIIVLNKEYQLIKVIDSFIKDGKEEHFNYPSSVFISDDNTMYIADTNNSRIVLLDSNGAYIRSYGEPAMEGVEINYVFKPIKIVVDFAGRIFVLSKNCNQGIIKYDKEGNFLGYFGALKTTPSMYEIFWKSIATDSQKKKMSLVIPTEYSGIDIDSKGFVYSTVSAIDSKNFDPTLFVHKLNPMGIDILKRNGFYSPMGDVKYIEKNDNGLPDFSRLCDVSISDYGVYSILDSNKGRVFTYNSNGELLFLFGGIGNNYGLFGRPVALASSNGKFLVLDNLYNQIVEFSPTKYATLMLSAIADNYNRNYEAASEKWMETLKYSSKSNIVFTEIGNTYYNLENYAQAIRFFKLADDKKDYSEAYGFYRNEVMSKYMGSIITIVITALLFFQLRRVLVKKRKGAKDK